MELKKVSHSLIIFSFKKSFYFCLEILAQTPWWRHQNLWSPSVIRYIFWNYITVYVFAYQIILNLNQTYEQVSSLIQTSFKLVVGYTLTFRKLLKIPCRLRLKWLNTYTLKHLVTYCMCAHFSILLDIAFTILIIIFWSYTMFWWRSKFPQNMISRKKSLVQELQNNLPNDLSLTVWWIDSSVLSLPSRN